MNYLKNQNWRYATKKFDKTRKVSAGELDLLKEAIQLSVSSYGLQPYKVLLIENQDLRAQLESASWDQKQITESSHLIVFCNYTDVESADVDAFIDLTAKSREMTFDDLKGYGDFIKSKISEKTKEERFNWTKSQTYLAMSNLLSACAELRIDACPMEGFEPDAYNEILGLTEKGLNASLIATIGYRSQDDRSQFYPKMRKPMEVLFEMM